MVIFEIGNLCSIQLVPTKLLLKIDRNANEVVCILSVSFVCKSINSYRGMPIICSCWRWTFNATVRRRNNF
ncbi:hypothetical protein T12_5511 [Trichinella patagoniensis]|uniref:Uncharacterized protein n=1 Tax=Trichinella patagoniensis TaxID=990121 RepID=A0A0V0ZUV1_9BILA|nr:hypothetical protein T12_5511 [Trichinella patagoniensis]